MEEEEEALTEALAAADAAAARAAADAAALRSQLALMRQAKQHAQQQPQQATAQPSILQQQHRQSNTNPLQGVRMVLSGAATTAPDAFAEAQSSAALAKTGIRVVESGNASASGNVRVMESGQTASRSGERGRSTARTLAPCKVPTREAAAPADAQGIAPTTSPPREPQAMHNVQQHNVQEPAERYHGSPPPELHQLGQERVSAGEGWEASSAARRIAQAQTSLEHSPEEEARTVVWELKTVLVALADTISSAIITNYSSEDSSTHAWLVDIDADVHDPNNLNFVARLDELEQCCRSWMLATALGDRGYEQKRGQGLAELATWKTERLRAAVAPQMGVWVMVLKALRVLAYGLCAQGEYAEAMCANARAMHIKAVLDLRVEDDDGPLVSVREAATQAEEGVNEHDRDGVVRSMEQRAPRALPGRRLHNDVGQAISDVQLKEGAGGQERQSRNDSDGDIQAQVGAKEALAEERRRREGEEEAAARKRRTCQEKERARARDAQDKLRHTLAQQRAQVSVTQAKIEGTVAWEGHLEIRRVCEPSPAHPARCQHCNYTLPRSGGGGDCNMPLRAACLARVKSGPGFESVKAWPRRIRLATVAESEAQDALKEERRPVGSKLSILVLTGSEGDGGVDKIRQALRSGASGRKAARVIGGICSGGAEHHGLAYVFAWKEETLKRKLMPGNALVCFLLTFASVSHHAVASRAPQLHHHSAGRGRKCKETDWLGASVGERAKRRADDCPRAGGLFKHKKWVNSARNVSSAQYNAPGASRHETAVSFTAGKSPETEGERNRERQMQREWESELQKRREWDTDMEGARQKAREKFQDRRTGRGDWRGGGGAGTMWRN